MGEVCKKCRQPISEEYVEDMNGFGKVLARHTYWSHDQEPIEYCGYPEPWRPEDTRVRSRIETVLYE